MFARVFILMLVLAPWVASAVEPAPPAWIRSRSGQFLVERWKPGTRPQISTSNVLRVQLEPTLVAVTCDRIRQALNLELGWPDHWSDAVSVVIRPQAPPEEPVRIIAVRFTDGWGYRMELPAEATEQRLVRAVVEVLLRERANRSATVRAAELPLWLVDGVAEFVRARTLGRLVLDSDTIELGNRRRGDVLRPVRELFQTRAPLSLDRLAWPTEVDVVGDGGELYRASSHVLVHELLRLPGGSESLARFVDLLPAYLNWQSAFLRAYGKHFSDFTQADKWWSLLAVHYSKHPERFYWSDHQSLTQLDEILTVPFEVRLRPDQLPLLTRVKLQKILSEWDYGRLDLLLTQKLNHLHALLLRCRPDQAELVGGYIGILGHYLQVEREAMALARTGIPPGSNARLIAETIRQLDRLDEDRRGQLLRQSVQVRR